MVLDLIQQTILHLALWGITPK